MNPSIKILTKEEFIVDGIVYLEIKNKVHRFFIKQSHRGSYYLRHPTINARSLVYVQVYDGMNFENIKEIISAIVGINAYDKNYPFEFFRLEHLYRVYRYMLFYLGNNLSINYETKKHKSILL